jgi:curved DNA-binding protein
MKYRDYYQTLGVSRDAGSDAIKSAYRRLARKYHPDVSKEPDAEERFKEVGEAYEVLRDNEKRASYDQLGSDWKAGQDFRPPPGWESVFRNSSRQSSGPSAARGDPFSRFFDDLFKAQQQQSPPRGGPVPPERFSVQIDLEEAFSGGNKQIRLTDKSAGGTRTLKVKIPAGVTDGQKIRLGGQGASDARGQRGDLIIELNIRRHPRFRLDGKDVFLDLPLAPWEAAVGTTIQVPTLAGTVELRVPEGAKSDSKLRLRKRGLGREPGDQYCVIKIVVPAARDEQSKALYAQLAELAQFNPREAW